MEYQKTGYHLSFLLVTKGHQGCNCPKIPTLVLRLSGGSVRDNCSVIRNKESVGEDAVLGKTTLQDRRQENWRKITMDGKEKLALYLVERTRVRTPGPSHLGLKPGSTTGLLCDLGKVISPL